jgi:ribosomal protein L13
VISVDGTAKIDKRGSRGHFVPSLGQGDRIVVTDNADKEVLAGSF